MVEEYPFSVSRLPNTIKAYLLCRQSIDNSVILEEHPPAGWEPAPSVHVNGRIYTVYGRWDDASALFDDSFTFVGIVSSHRWSLVNPKVNLQTNHPHIVGARLYHSGDYIIVSQFKIAFAYRSKRRRRSRGIALSKAF